MLLPTTLEGFDALVATLVKKYKLKDAHHTAAILSIAIRHLPATQAYATLDYFGQYIQKNIANYVANHKAQGLKHESEVDQLVNLLKNDPYDTQARDKLQLAANEGSKYAESALAKLEPVDNPMVSQSAN